MAQYRTIEIIPDKYEKLLMVCRLKIPSMFKFLYPAIAKVVSSAGQSKFAMSAVSDYFKISQNANYGISTLAMTAGLMVNVSIRLPVVYAHYHQPRNDVTNALPAENSNQLNGHAAKIFYYSFIPFAFIASEISDPLNAYLGGIVLLENILGGLSIDIHDIWWKEVIAQSSGFILALGIALANYPYDFKFAKNNLLELASALDRRLFALNKPALETLMFMLPVMVGAPLLSFFFTRPALLKLPGSELILQEIGILILAGIIAASAFVKCFSSLPSIYSTFQKFHVGNSSNDLQTNYPLSFKSVAVRCGAGFGGAIDSVASGVCMLVGAVSTGLLLFDLSKEHEYDWKLLVVAAIIALSQAIQNALFGIYPGYTETMYILHAKEVDKIASINELNDAAVEAQNVSHHRRHSIDEDGTIPPLLQDSNRVATTVNIYRRNSAPELLFQPNRLSLTSSGPTKAIVDMPRSQNK